MRKRESRQEHCKLESGEQYRSQKEDKNNVIWSRKCSTEAGEPSGAMQVGVKMALQTPETKQEQCKPEPEWHCRFQKKTTCIA